MTLQQQVANRIGALSDEGAEFIDQVLNTMNPSFFVINVTNPSMETKSKPAKRFGIARDYLDECKDFDKYNEEIADIFDGENV